MQRRMTGDIAIWPHLRLVTVCNAVCVLSLVMALFMLYMNYVYKGVCGGGGEWGHSSPLFG